MTKMHYIITMEFDDGHRGTVSGDLVGAGRMTEEQRFQRIWAEAVDALNEKHGISLTKDNSSVTYYRLVREVPLA